jgi:hypothetical protein
MLWGVAGNRGGVILRQRRMAAGILRGIWENSPTAGVAQGVILRQRNMVAGAIDYKRN